MTPRLDPETRPQAAGFQIITRGQLDQYGAERGYRGHPRGTTKRAVATRNGLPVRSYRYRGTGQSRPELDAQWVRDRRRKETR